MPVASKARMPPATAVDGTTGTSMMSQARASSRMTPAPMPFATRYAGTGQCHGITCCISVVYGGEGFATSPGRRLGPLPPM